LSRFPWIWCQGSFKPTTGDALWIRREEREREHNIKAQFSNRILIQYRYQGSDVAILRLRPMIGDRDFHHQQQASQICTFHNWQGSSKSVCKRFDQTGHPGNCAGRRATIKQTKFGTGIITCRETRRGLGDTEDLYSPGY